MLCNKSVCKSLCLFSECFHFEAKHVLMRQPKQRIYFFFLPVRTRECLPTCMCMHLMPVKDRTSYSSKTGTDTWVWKSKSGPLKSKFSGRTVSSLNCWGLTSVWTIKEAMTGKMFHQVLLGLMETNRSKLNEKNSRFNKQKEARNTSHHVYMWISYCLSYEKIYLKQSLTMADVELSMQARLASTS